MNLKNTIIDYLDSHQTETFNSKLLTDLIERFSEKQLVDRKNFDGHFTASAFIVCRATKRVLMIKHKVLGFYLQPGGHIEKNDTSLLAAVYREIREETGLESHDIKYRSAIPGKEEVPFNIDTHTIPHNPKKAEPEHFHHDLNYLFTVEKELFKEISDDESQQIDWINWEDFISYQHFSTIAKKIEPLLTEKSEAHFFSTLINAANCKITPDTHIIIIQHVIPNSFNLLKYLHYVTKGNLTVFAKPKSIDTETRDKLQSLGLDIRIAKRVKGDFSHYLNVSNKKLILADIGGYFSELATQPGHKILGIVEDTENGHKRYQEVSQKLLYPVFSVARSPLKTNEDKLVGESIVHSAEYVLRNQNVLLDYTDSGIIGYGKIGEGIAGRLLKSNIKPMVSEINPQRLVKAVNNYCTPLNKQTLLQNCKIIFSASGSQAIGADDFKHIRDGAYVFSVTSSEDEFQIDKLNTQYTCTKTSPLIKRFVSENNYFYLVNDGNAVNFIQSNGLGPFIYVVMGEILYTIMKIANSENQQTKMILELSEHERDIIAQLWLDEFTDIA